MILIRYTFFAMLFCLLAAAQTASAQCTTDAGSISGPSFMCANNPLSINNIGNETLDANDILIFVAYTGAAPNASTVFATSTDVNFTYQNSFLANSPFKVAAVAGNDAGGGLVDWNDPCLSVSPPVTVTCLPQLQVEALGGTLTCFNPFVVLNVTANQQNCTYLWSDGNTSPVLTVQQPGQYCVTVTNQAGCSATDCAIVTMDISSPVVAVATPALLTCSVNSITLDISGSSQGSNYTYLWVGPGITPANQFLQNPVITTPGTYSLIVTNTVNGCTATAAVVVLADIQTPQVDAGPDTGIPCGGGTTILDANSSPSLIYAWSGPNSFVSNLATPTVSEPGTYTLTVTDLNGCTATDQVTVFPGPVIPQQDFSVTPVQCFGETNGAIALTMSVGQSPFTITWTGPNGFTSAAEDIGNLPAGTYSISALDNTGCTYYANVVVGGPVAPLAANMSVGGISCAGNDGTITMSIAGGTPPYLISWSNGATGPVIQNLAPGPYSATVTDANGCSIVIGPVIIVQAAPVLLTVEELSASCSSTVVKLVITGAVPPYILTGASGPLDLINNTFVQEFTLPGLYTYNVVDANGCPGTVTFNIQSGGGTCGYISGSVIRDVSENCLADTGEPALGGWLVRADGAADTLYGVTDSEGKYYIGVPLGDYTVTAIAPNALWEVCPAGTSVSVNVLNDTFPAADIPVKKVLDCPALSVSIGTNQLRRCFSNNYYFIEYCNNGTDIAENAYVVVTLDAFLSPIWSTLPYVSVGNNALRFDVGNLDVGECGTFTLQVLVSCNAVLGQTHCTEAHIYPDSVCVPNDPSWSGASLKVSSQCDADSVRFIVKNIGAGDMSGTVDYVIIEDAVMLMAAPLQALGSGDSVTLSFPANGSTWRLEVDQVAFHPGNSQPGLSLEGCSANASFSTGFVTQFTVNDADPWVDIDCTPNTGSYDPNDKQGFPAGYGTAHYIRPGTELEYLIRFQNTGTDTAFTVRVVDTLSAWFDPASIRPGASSHDYQFNLTGPGIVEFLFENILLPDSNVNEPASNGFVKFSILPRADAPLETVIENDAAIYFDFNDPVITNTTFHRLGENFLLRAWHPFVPGATVSVSPNPFSDEATLQIQGLLNSASLRLQVFDLQGHVVGEMEAAGPEFHLKKGDWPAGVYLFRISQEGKLVGSGKLAVH